MKASGSGFRCEDACDFAVRPEDGRDVNAFSCIVKFQQEDDNEEHSFDLYPGFTPLKVEENKKEKKKRKIIAAIGKACCCCCCYCCCCSQAV